MYGKYEQVPEQTAPEQTADVTEPARQTPYMLLGGEAGVRQLVDRFYDIMDREPAVAPIRAMHAADLGPMRERLFEFMSGWLGGPPLFFQRADSVCITKAHRLFAIGEDERDQWMLCMRQALVDIGVVEELRQVLDAPLLSVADFLRNR